MNTWIPPERRPPHYDLFHRLFHCRVPYGLGREDHDIEMFGHYTSGDPERDRETQNEMVHRYIPISDMVKYYRRGVVVHVVDGAVNTPIIYEIIDRYLKIRRNLLISEPEIPSAQLMTDLYDLDEFAGVIYEHAAPHFDKTVENTVIGKGFQSVQGLSQSGILERIRRNKENRKRNPDTESVNDPVYKERRKIFESFTGPVTEFTPASTGSIDYNFHDDGKNIEEIYR